MRQVQIHIAGGGPVGMTLACDLARRGITCMLVERNLTTTRHPKMDITSLSGHELHRFHYPSVMEWRRIIHDVNDGSMPAEPPMRVSQVEIEPVLQRSIQAEGSIEARWGVEHASLMYAALERIGFAPVRHACCDAGRRRRFRFSEIVGRDSGRRWSLGGDRRC